MNLLAKYISIGIIGLATIELAFADTAAPTENLNPQIMSLQKSDKCSQSFHHFDYFKHSFTGSWFIGLHHAKQLTPVQAKIVAEAAVILYGDSSMQVGKIIPISGKDGHQNYQIQITNTSGQLLTTLKMNGSNGTIMKPFVPMLNIQPAN